jgi:hypothetical protein
MGGVAVAGEEGARAGHLVGGDARPGAGPAYDDAAVGVPACNHLGHGAGVVRIVNRRRRRVGAQVHERQVGFGGEASQQQLLEFESRVIGGDGDAH